MTRYGRITAVVMLAVFVLACQNQTTTTSNSGTNAYDMTGITQAIETHQDAIMALDDVVAIGASECNGTPCIRVLLASDNQETLKKLPQQIDGIQLIAEISGPISAN